MEQRHRPEAGPGKGAAVSGEHEAQRRDRQAVRATWGRSVPVTLRARPPQRSATIHGLKLPACMAARVQGRQVALGGPRVGGVQEREGERKGGLNARLWGGRSGGPLERAAGA